MRIVIVTPAPPRSRKGNRVTADRYEELFRRLGHNVQTVSEYSGEKCDVFVVLHAYKNYRAMKLLRGPKVLVLTGTDIYNNARVRAISEKSMGLATRIVALQKLALKRVPQELRRNVSVIVQSAKKLRIITKPVEGFEVCVSGHLRTLKDPFRAAYAARLLPRDSRIVITHIGGALTTRMQTLAKKEAA